MVSSGVSHSPDSTPAPLTEERRSFFARASTAAMVLSLAASYGGCASMGGRFLYPKGDRKRIWQFVIEVDRMEVGASLPFRAPDGQRLTIARQGESGEVGDFIALSSTCPHLGCQVQWQGGRDRFFCPCHNGVFDSQGKSVSGPPAEAGQDLPRFPLRIRGGLLYIEVPAEGLQA